MTSEAKFFYTNGTEAYISATDFTLKFFRLGRPRLAPLTPEELVNLPPAEVVDALSVGMSLECAKGFLPLVVQIILNHESRHGKIPVTPEVADHWRAVFGSEP